MSKKRCVSEDICFSTDMNSLSDFEERTFIRLLTISDDFGVIPGDRNRIRKMVGYEENSQVKFSNAVELFLEKSMLTEFSHNGKYFLLFNPERFDNDQVFIRTKRTKSEFIGIKALNRQEFSSGINSEKFGEIRRKVSEKDSPKVIKPIKYKVIKYKEEGEIRRNLNLAELLLSEIRKNDSKAKEPNLEKWAKDIRLLNEQDERSHEEIEEVIKFSQSDNFWKTVILSASNLRKHFAKLFLLSQQHGNTKAKPATINSSANDLNLLHGKLVQIEKNFSEQNRDSGT